MARIDRGSLAVAGLVIAMLLLGMVGGVALDRWALRPFHRGWRAQLRDSSASTGFDPARVRSRLSERLARDLGLTALQRMQLDSLLTRQQEEARAVMREMRPRLDAVTARTNDGLRTILTAEQFERWERLSHERMQNRRQHR